MKRVLILLSTYNGELYLREQLDSLYEQEGIAFDILVRDDGSTDHTIMILEEYRNRFSHMHIIKGINIGAGHSFYALMHYAKNNIEKYDYYAFCDQDDVWFQNKLKLSMSALEKETNPIKLFYSQVIEVDSKLAPLERPRIISVVNSFNANLISSHSLGCTQVFSYDLFCKSEMICERINDFDKNRLPIHDCWVSLVAYSLDATVVYSEAPTMYYRQHGKNVIGTGGSSWKVFKARINRFIHSNNPVSYKAFVLLSVLGDAVSPYHQDVLYKCAHVYDRFINRFDLLFERNLFSNYDIITNMGARIATILGKL